MILRDLVADLPLSWYPGAAQGDELEVEGVCHDSRQVETGDLFVTWQGEKWDGQAFVER